MNQDLQQNLSAEDLELNQQLGLAIPETEVEANKPIWLSYFRLVRYMYRAELVSVENIPKFTEKFVNSVNKETYLGKLKDYIGEKIDENKIFDSIAKQDEIIAKLKDALEIVPAENAAQFIGEIFNGNPPQQLLDQLGIVVQDLPQFSPEEIEILQQARIKEVLDTAKRRPLRASNLPAAPGFNQPFSPEAIGQIVDQFGQNYNQVQLQKQAQERARANQPYIPGRYQVNQPQPNNNATILPPIPNPNFATNSNPGPNLNQDPNDFTPTQIRAVPAKRVVFNRPAVNPNPGLPNNYNYVLTNPQIPTVSQYRQTPQQMPSQQRAAINNPVFNQQRRNPGPAINNPSYTPNPQMPSAPVQDSFRQNSSLPHKDNLNLQDLLGGN